MWAFGNSDKLSDNDKSNLDDLIIIAAELLYSIKIYEWSVLNSINFILISLLELAVSKSPQNNTLRIWLMKILAKLGLASRFTGVAQNVKGYEDEDFEKLGALKYSHFQAYGTERELENTCQRYEKYYSEASIKNKSELVNGFKNRDFEELNGLL